MFSVAMLAALSGCATDDTPTASGGGGGQVKADPSLATDVQEIFDRRGCSGSSCHDASAQGGLDLRAGHAHSELVNVLSSTQPGLFRVRPGHALDSSYLVDILDGTIPPPEQMPQGDVPLDSIDLQNIINWIHMGAKDN